MYLNNFLFGAIYLLMQKQAEEYEREDYLQTLKEIDGDLNFPNVQTYDFIIVGGGTAGCLLAGRLSEHFNVLLLESGGYPIPASYNHHYRKEIEYTPAVNDAFYSTLQHNFTQETGGIVENWMGRMLGGSGSHNGNIYNRGSPLDYDRYAHLTNDSSWSYNNVLKHFKNIENYVGGLENEADREALYGSSGPLTIDTDVSGIDIPWMEAGRELGYKVMDPNGRQTEGFARAAKSMKNGERDSTYTAYVKPYIGQRSTLTVLKYSTVDQVLINNQGVAYGVTYERHGFPQIAHASKDVILSAGSYSTPIILMKSGIGPSDLLTSAGIAVKQDLPGVGKNLRDHSAVSLEFTARSPNPDWFKRLHEDGLEDEISKYMDPNGRTGFFTQMEKPQAFITSSVAKAYGEGDWPDLQIVYTVWGIPAVVPENETERVFKVSVILNRLESVGEVEFDVNEYLNGERRIHHLAKINHNLYTVDDDVRRQIDGIQFALKLMGETTPFQNSGVEYTESPPEGCVGLPFRSEEYWRCYITQRATNYYHPTGTCKMGLESDPMAVVDSKLKVRSVPKLRIVDASILPVPTNANLNAAVILLAEKAAHDILNEYQPEPSPPDNTNSCDFMKPTSMVLIYTVMTYLAII